MAEAKAARGPVQSRRFGAKLVKLGVDEEFWVAPREGEGRAATQAGLTAVDSGW